MYCISVNYKKSDVNVRKKLAFSEIEQNNILTELVNSKKVSTIYAHSSEQQKQSAGVFDDTIRISVGIEDIADLIDDFKNAAEMINN